MARKNLITSIIERIPLLRDLVLGRRSIQLSEIKFQLASLGYMVEISESEDLDELTRRALRLFQKFYKLEETGELDPETMEALKAPRCGNEDLLGPRPLGPIPFALVDFAPDLKRGCSFHDVTTLTYTIGELPRNGGLDAAQVQSVIDKAFKSWQREIPINFEPAQEGINATFKLKWAEGLHGDGELKKFESSQSLYAHAFYPPDCNEEFTGECHFNNNHIWGLSHNAGGDLVFDLETVALHEIGHLLGLTHSTDVNSIMAPAYFGKRRQVKGDALEAIQSIYGPRLP